MRESPADDFITFLSDVTFSKRSAVSKNLELSTSYDVNGSSVSFQNGRIPVCGSFLEEGETLLPSNHSTAGKK